MQKRDSSDFRTAILTEQRIGIFVDVQNMFYSAKCLHQAKLNFSTLLEDITKKRKLIRALTYIIQTPENDQSGFIAALKNIGYEIRSKELKQRADGSSKGDWDMGIAIDAVAMASRLDVICLVSGDGDFVDLVNMLKSQGLKVEVYSFPGSTADSLIEAATEYTAIGEKHLIR